MVNSSIAKNYHMHTFTTETKTISHFHVDLLTVVFFAVVAVVAGVVALVVVSVVVVDIIVDATRHVVPLSQYPVEQLVHLAVP